MELFEAIVGRRSIRSFKDKEVEDEKVGKILEACRWSPSAGNRQPWEIIVVQDHELKEKIAKAAFDQIWIADAPLVFAVCINKKIARSTYAKRGEMYAFETIGMAIQNMMLVAYSLGLGSCCVGAFEEESIGDILNCPDLVKPVALLPVGYPDEKPTPPPKDEVSSFTYLNQYGTGKYKPEWKGVSRYRRDLRRKISKALRES